MIQYACIHEFRYIIDTLDDYVVSLCRIYNNYKNPVTKVEESELSPNLYARVFTSISYKNYHSTRTRIIPRGVTTKRKNATFKNHRHPTHREEPTIRAIVKRQTDTRQMKRKTQRGPGNRGRRVSGVESDRGRRKKKERVKFT